MADVVGDVQIDVHAAFESGAFEANVASAAKVARNEMGQFVKVHRTMTEQMMADFNSIISSGTQSAVGVIGANMSKAADAAGSSFTARLGAALKSIPGSVGTALSSGVITMATSAMNSAGNAASEAFAERVKKSAPYWKAAFSQAFGSSADPAVNQMVKSVGDKARGLGDAFTHVGIDISAKLGKALAEAANVIQPALAPAIERARAVGAQFQETLAAAGKAGMEKLASGVRSGASALTPIIANLANSAGKVMQSGMQKAGELGQKALQLPFGKMLGTALGVAIAGAVVVGGAKAVGAAAKLGVDMARNIGEKLGAGLKALGSMIGSALSAAGSAVISAAGRIGQGAAKAMGDALKLGANAVGTAVTGILGVSLTKGLNRLKAIDNAEASLRGLAATANHVPEIMNAATNAVTGTAFGLDQAAKAASQFAAAGVPVSEMERHLGSLAKTAAAAGGDFDGVASIFSKVAATGKVTGEVLAQLTDRGLAALPALAEQLGVTAEEAQKMVSEGKVSFDDFSKAMDAAMGNIAIEQATTFAGLMSNVGAAMGRMGATFQRPIFEAVKTALPGVMNLFNQLEAYIKPIADVMANLLAPAAERLGAVLEGLNFGFIKDAETGDKILQNTASGAESLFSALGPLLPVVGGLAAAFAGPLLTSLPIVGSLFTGLTGPVGILGGALISLFAIKPETLLNGFKTIESALPGMLNGIVSAATGLLPQLAAQFAANAPILIQGFANIIQQLAATVAQLAPVIIPIAVQAIVSLATALIGALPTLIQAGLQLLLGLVQGIVQAIPVLVAAIPTIISSLVNAFTTALPMLLTAGVQIILGLVLGIVGAIPQLIEAIISAIPMIVTALIGAIPQLVDAALQLFLGIVTGLLEAIPQIIDALFDLLPQLLDAIVAMMPALGQAALKLFLGLMEAIIKAAPKIVTALIDLIVKLISFVVSSVGKMLNAAKEFIGGIWSGMEAMKGKITDALIRIIATLVTRVASFVSKFVQGAKDLITGMINGFKSMVSNIGSAIANLVTGVVNRVKGFVSNFRSAAGDLINGLVSGIRNAAGAVVDAIVGVASNAVNAFKNFLGIASPSKVFKGFGENVGQGLAMGIGAMKGSVADALDSLVPDDGGVDIDLTPSITGRRPFAPGIDSAGEGAFLDPNRPIELVIVDTDGSLVARMRTEVNRALSPMSMGSLQAELGVG